MTSPTNNLQVAPGATVTCAVTPATDSDHWRTQWSPNGDEADHINYDWTASGGSFSTPGYASTSWTAPATPGTYTLTCTIDDDAIIPQGDLQGGSSSPFSTRTDSPVVRTVNVVVSSPPKVTVSSAQPSVCAGGVASAVHQTTVTATLKDYNDVALLNKSVTFTVANAVATDLADEKGSLSSSTGTVNSDGSLTKTTDSNGQATVTFTSSQIIGAKNVIVATCDGKASLPVTISMANESGTVTLDKTDLIADGVDFATLTLPLTSSGLPVDGHTVTWRISKVTDEDGVEVNAANYADYGSLSNFSAAPNANGIYTAKFTTGTKGGTISFQATDNSVFSKGLASSVNTSGNNLSSTSGGTSTSSTRLSPTFDYESAKPAQDIQVVVVNVDSSSPASTTVQYRLVKGTLSGVTFYAPGLPNGVVTYPNTLNFSLTYNQRDVPLGSSPITLVYKSTSNVQKKVSFTVSKTHTRAVSNTSASVNVPDDNTGFRIVFCRTSFYEDYGVVTYSVPLVAGSKTVITRFTRESLVISKDSAPRSFGALHNYSDNASGLVYFQNYMVPGTYPSLVDPNASEIEFKRYLATDSFFPDVLVGAVRPFCDYTNLDGSSLLVAVNPNYDSVIIR